MPDLLKPGTLGKALRPGRPSSAAERVVPIFIELQLTLKYFAASPPPSTPRGPPSVGRCRLAAGRIQDGRPGREPAAVTSLLAAEWRGAGPAVSRTLPATNTRPSNITGYSTRRSPACLLADTHAHISPSASASA